MSKFIISNRHIDALVRAAFEMSGGANLDFNIDICGECIHYDDPDEMGQILLDLNYYLVNWRYRENNKSGRYKYQSSKLLRPVQILKVCDCYDYQCCNVGVYESTESGSIINTIRKHFIQQIPGYDEAEWHIS